MEKNRTKNYHAIRQEHRPLHDGDAFSVRHPKMDITKRAKLFMPFDALRGFDAAIDIAKSSAVLVRRRDLDEGETAALDKKLRRLSGLFQACRRHHRTMTVSATHFVEKAKDGNGAPLGAYEAVRGDLTALNPVHQYLVIDSVRIAFSDIGTIEAC